MNLLFYFKFNNIMDTVIKMKLKLIVVILLCVFTLTSCTQKNKNTYNGSLDEIQEIHIEALSCNMEINIDNSINQNIQIDFNKDIDESNYKDNLYSLKSESISGKILLKKADILRNIFIDTKVIDIKIYNILADELTINSEVAFSFIASTNINTLNFKISRSKGFYIHDSSVNSLKAVIDSCEFSSIHNNTFDNFEIQNYRNDFKFSNSTFKKGTFIKETGNLDIGLPGGKGVFAEINCPNVLFDFETVCYENKYFYLIPEYELYITNPNGAVSITRYFPE